MTKNVTKWSSWETFFLTALLSCVNFIGYSSAESNIGCLFLESLCLDNIEWCFDDYAFGKCLPIYGSESEQDGFDRKPLNEEQSRILATMLEELQGAGLGWDHLFVQCRMQGALFSLRNNVPMPPNLCANLAPDPDILDSRSPLAFVRFQPPDDAYADEFYFPPDKKGFDDRLFMQPLKSIQPLNKLTSRSFYGGPYSAFENADVSYKGEDYEENAVRSEEIENRIKDIKNRIELRKMLAEYESGNLKPPIYYQQNLFEDFDDSNDAFGMEHYLQPVNKRSEYDLNDYHFSDDSPRFLARLFNTKKDYSAQIPIPPKIRESPKFSELYRLFKSLQPFELPTTSFREISRELHIPKVDLSHHKFKNNNNFHRELDLLQRDAEQTNELPVDQLKLSSLMPYDKPDNILPNGSGVYTEGGLVYLSDSNKHQSMADRKTEARNMLSNMLGFTRHERLDVKKPGPPAAPPPSSQSPHETPILPEIKNIGEKKEERSKEVLPAHIKDGLLPKIKKVLHADEDHGPYSVDTDYTHVILKTPIEDWKDGPRIVTALAELLNMQSYFTFSRLDRHEITFRVEENPEKKTAADVARAINDSRFKNNLSRRLGVIVIRAGVGDKTKEANSVIYTKREFAEDGPNVTHVLIYMVAGAGLAAVVVIIITLLLIRRNDKKRDKLGGLQAGLIAAEASSKDYQELCRARMAGKGNDSPSGRMASMCKDNEKAPSSRSSTSSWSEEPALTNMDISTGHMVLSYMESHLKNKGRLQREWEALQRYEAEPSSRDTAIQPQCEPLNRPTAPLPYDHSRVVINHLANAEGLDYVNASTITDHDPRAPAYVAAQGPLPSTLAHFWQMVWEQGAVVIVALCKLQENGEIACARYWPEEGAEVYHIYEVNLVSEHIWCEDYLVRSFYLKNLRTGETRTVTQFHFLSWPPAGVPLAAKALLEFRRKVNKSYRGRSCPIVVHSSNGAGRTGAYILLDLVLARMNKGAREIDIAATLEHLRDQRSGLVATKQQFEFVLMAVAEEVHAILKALPANSQNEKRELDNEAVKEQETEKETTDKSDETTEIQTDV